MFFALAFLFWFGGWLILRGDIDFEAMFMVLNPVLLSSFGVGMAAQGLGDVGKSKKAVNRVFAIIDRKPSIDCSSESGMKLTHVKGDIEWKNVAFAYPSRPDSQIYTNYSLKIQEGQTLALVGGSGSGKSTAINLIERFYDPLDGSVFLDGHNVRDIHVQSLRNHISMVSQEPVLFGGTIADNIAMGKPNATRAEVEDAAKKANAHAFIMQFPNGYETSVGDRGVQVSGGQKQRIAIARAIIRDPAVLLLDEATSALDAESERIVQTSLDALLKQKKRTTIIVAHRLSTVRNADVIAVVHEGRVAELGTHEELMLIPNGLYKNLVARQIQH
jgi:ATP-binding cassette subfamily B (MDR/TAP) protein 1